MKLLQEFIDDYRFPMVKITVDISTVRRWVIKSRDYGRNMDVNNTPRCG
jgi:hypothetical protein